MHQMEWLSLRLCRLTNCICISFLFFQLFCLSTQRESLYFDNSVRKMWLLESCPGRLSAVSRPWSLGGGGGKNQKRVKALFPPPPNFPLCSTTRQQRAHRWGRSAQEPRREIEGKEWSKLPKGHLVTPRSSTMRAQATCVCESGV